MIRAAENLTGRPVGELLGVAARENNAKRGYLLVNRCQAKHVPVAPSRALALFDRLGERLYGELKGERVVFIGFAETATAIGARVAAGFPGEGWTLHTTREAVDERLSVVDFREEHSHATQQRLFCADLDMLTGADRIVFVEDELTTGQTILNFVAALERRGLTGRFGAVSLVNGMGPEHLARFAAKNIPVRWLLKLDGGVAELQPRGDHLPEPLPAGVPARAALHELPGRPEPRTGLPAGEYRSRCEVLAREAAALIDPADPDSSDSSLDPDAGGRILVLGTEECMYPAILCGARLEAAGRDVRVHATTRSPILVGGADNPLIGRVSLRSLYEAARPTYLYNLAAYARVLVVTDAPALCREGLADLLAALGSAGCRTATIVRWTP